MTDRQPGDIVERLRESASRDQVVARNWGEDGRDVTGQLDEAADEITELRAERDAADRERHHAVAHAIELRAQVASLVAALEKITMYEGSYTAKIARAALKAGGR